MDATGHSPAAPQPPVHPEEAVGHPHDEEDVDYEEEYEEDEEGLEALNLMGEEEGEEGLEDEEAAALAEEEDIDGEEEEDEEDDEELTDEEEEEEEEEEEQMEVYPLPPLPPVHAPPKVHGITTTEVYSIIKELRRQMDDPVERERARSMLLGDTDVLLAVAQVLQEAHLLRRSTVNEHGEVEEQLVRQPEAPRPSLPTGYNSWIVETPANVRR